MIGRPSTTGIVFGIVALAVCLIGALVASPSEPTSFSAGIAPAATGSEEAALPRGDDSESLQTPRSLPETAQVSARESVGPSAEFGGARAKVPARQVRRASLLARTLALARAGRLPKPVLEEGPELYSAVARTLLEDGDTLGASQAFLEVLELEPSNEVAIDRLVDLDPAGALAVLGTTPATLDRARLLAAAGRIDHARALLEETLAEAGKSPEYFDVMREIDPAAFETAARERLSEADGEISAWSVYFTIALARLCGETERIPEAVLLLEDLLAREAQPTKRPRSMPDPRFDAIRALLSIDLQRALVHLEAQPRDSVPSSLWVRAGESLLGERRIQDAIDLWERAGFDSEAFDHLKQHAPERLWTHLTQLGEVAERSRSDDDLGILGDYYWQSDRREQATELWQKASRVDSSYDKWTGKLRTVAAGGDPCAKSRERRAVCGTSIGMP